MFSVPGWNVSAPIATQVEKPKPKDPNKLGKKALKRKEKQEQQVNAENIGELWDKVVDGKDAGTSEQTSAVLATAVRVTGDDTQEKRGKKRKRGKSHKDKQQAEDSATKTSDSPAPEEKDAPAKAANVPTEKSTTIEGESKREKKKRKKEAHAPSNIDPAKSTEQNLLQSTDLTSLIPEPAGLTPLQRSMRSKLASARFRHLNESLYTKPSVDSLSLFKEDPSMFEDYHRGFAQQVQVWPSNPVDSYVESILQRGRIHNRDPWKEAKRKAKNKNKATNNPAPEPTSHPIKLIGNSKPLPRNHKNICTIADLGCGTASLSYRLQPHLTTLHITLHSFDLSKPTGPSGPLVTVADIAHVPLPDASVDVAIFCLALMGTNWLDFIDEAYRLLRWRGELWIAEIKSRFGRVERTKGQNGPVNSIGSLRKIDQGKNGNKKMMMKKNKGKEDTLAEKDEGIVDSADESELAERVDGVDAKQGTDVSAFIQVLQKRGFVLDALPERQGDAIDLSNKMFVKLQFIKSAQPIKGKNAKEGAAARAEGKFETSRAIKFGIKGKKFDAVAGEDEDSDAKEMEVLKPCLYKIR